MTGVRQRVLDDLRGVPGLWLESGDVTAAGQLQLDSGRLGR